MHIPDGILPTHIIAGGYIVTTALMSHSLRQINKAENPRAGVPKAALLTAAFFIASSIRIPLPPPMTSAHLLLCGLMGVILGYYAFPAITIGLILQAIVFGHGGFTTVGVNAVILGVPALLMHNLFQLLRTRKTVSDGLLGTVGFLAGSLGIVFAALLFYTVIIFNLPADIDPEMERSATALLSISHAPVAIAEGLFTALLVTYLRRIRPNMLNL